MSTVVAFKPAKEPPKDHRSAMETLIFTANQIGAWRIPPFQRPVRVNAKVQALSEEIKKDGGVVPGVITLGTLRGESATYVVDGQHRLEAFRISGLSEFIGDFRLVSFDSMAEMAQEFVTLNSALVRMRPDDILRGLESSMANLRKLRKECPFVGYDQIRRGTSGPILSMSLTLRVWSGSQYETPSSHASIVGGAAGYAEALTDESAEELIRFLITAHTAWGRDNEYARLWSSLNLGLCMWLWRRLVTDRNRAASKRYILLSVNQFKNCLMSLSANSHYLDWLQGRLLTDRDRAPGYARIKKIFEDRLAGEIKTKIMFPKPAWATTR